MRPEEQSGSICKAMWFIQQAEKETEDEVSSRSVITACCVALFSFNNSIEQKFLKQK